MRTALRGRGTRHDDERRDERHDDVRAPGARIEPAHLRLRAQPRPLG